MNNTALIIDAIELCKVFEDFLKNKGFTIEVVHTLEEAKTRLLKLPLPDLVLCDTAILEQPNNRFLKEIRILPWKEGFPLVPLSTHPIAANKAKSLGLRADDCLVQPFDLGEFEKRLERLHIQRNNSHPSRDSLNDVLSNFLRKNKEPAQPKKTGFSPERRSEPPRPSKDGKSFLSPLLSLLLNPIDFFMNKKEALTQQFLLTVIGLFSIGMGLQSGIHKSSLEVTVITALGVAILCYALTAVTAWILHWIFGFKHHTISFNDLLHTLGAFWLPVAYSSLLGILYVVVSGGDAGEFTGGLLLLLPMQSPASTIGFILRRIDVFEMWGVYLITMALVHVFHLPKKATTQWTFGVWAALVVLLGIVRGIMP